VTDGVATDSATATARAATETSSSRLQAEATSLDNGDILDVVMGCSYLRALMPVSLPEALDTTYSTLLQAWDVFHQERVDLEVEQLHIKEWDSLLKSWTKSEKENVVKKREQLDVMEDLLTEEQVAIGVLDQKAQKLLKDAKELHAVAEAYVNANIKLQEDLNWRVNAISQREQKMAERE
jgi:hypothetical protein